MTPDVLVAVASVAAAVLSVAVGFTRMVLRENREHRDRMAAIEEEHRRKAAEIARYFAPREPAPILGKDHTTPRRHDCHCEACVAARRAGPTPYAQPMYYVYPNRPPKAAAPTDMHPEMGDRPGEVRNVPSPPDARPNWPDDYLEDRP